MLVHSDSCLDSSDPSLKECCLGWPMEIAVQVKVPAMQTKWPEFNHQNPEKCRRPEVTVSSCPPRPKHTDHAHTDMIITISKIVKLKEKNQRSAGMACFRTGQGHEWYRDKTTTGLFKS